MNYASVVRVLALVMLILAGSSLPAILTAVAYGESEQVFAFLAMVLGISVISTSILFLTPRPRQKARPSDALGLVILWWFLAPVAACLPFVVGVQNASFFRQSTRRQLA
jgi:trk system potassium uptake protein TrkH